MSPVRYAFALWAIFGFWISGFAVDTMTGVFNDRVKSLQVRLFGDPYAPPVINLGTDDRLLVSFDHLAEDREYLRYQLVHCNASWQPSGLVDGEFLDGFNLGYIENFEYSRQPYIHYVHYTLVIPNEDVRPKLSGNYLLKIFPENDPDDVWLQCRFMVSEQTAVIGASISGVTDIDYNVAHQQLSISVDTERSEVEDPFNDLTVMIQQNGRYDNEVAVRKPLRMASRNVSVYEHLPELIFEAGNEYRRMETVSTNYPGMGVAEISYAEPYYHFTLHTDGPRCDQMYLYDQTQHGRFTVREYNSADGDIDADYGVVHFSLDIPEMEDAMIFIDGDFVNRRFDQESMMTYNRATGRYERNMLLKQGAYNYNYLVVPKGKSRGYTAPIEGDKFQADNEYLIKVYARHPGDRYDRLVGVSTVCFQ